MRSLKLLIATIAVGGAMAMAASGPAAAYDYPWCAQGKGFGIPGECSYQSYGQCMASASGRNLSCNVNPRVAFDRSRRGYPRSPDPYRQW
jgi:hypothetical protein